jgi:hypothetical protein
MSKQSTRQMVTMTAKQYEWIKRKADRLGISVSETIRRIIDEYREREEE